MNREQPTELDAIVERCGHDLREFAHTFRSEAFYIPTPHDEETDKFLRLLSDPAISHSLIIAHRGWGKTSWVVTELLKAILYRQTNCAMYCSLTEKSAMQRTDALKRELERNRLILSTFGDMRSDKWAQGEWCTAPFIDPAGS